MALKNILNTLKQEGYVIKRLDQYLLSLQSKDEDRRWDINSPSSAGKCPREIVYSRLGYEQDSLSVDSRLRRIFDNGTHTHERLQRYMLDEGILLMDEVPVFYDDLQIQGHTDGLLQLTPAELGVLEIKSINSNGFTKLVDAKEEHKLQASVYMFSLEARRKYLKKRFKRLGTLKLYLKSKAYKQFIKDHYKHLKGGAKHTLEQKHHFKYLQHRQADLLLWGSNKPITKMIFLYENKDTQELKEYTVTWNDGMMDELKEKFEYINEFVTKKEVPPRPAEATSKSCGHCRWCNFKLECWIV